MIMIKIIFFDIDGTLRGFKEKGIRSSVYEAIDLAKSQGVKCFIATGRHPFEIKAAKLLGDLEFDGYIYLNGSYCVNGNGNVLHHMPLHASQIQALIDMRSTLDFATAFLGANEIYINRVTPLVKQVHQSVISPIPPIVSDMQPLVNHCFYQAVIYGEPETLDQVVSRLPLCKAVYWGSKTAINIIAADSDKCVGIERTLQALNLPIQSAAAVGDANNDAQMLKAVGFGVAMGNGYPEAKAAADYIAPHIDDDGLLKAVKRILRENA